MKTNVTQEAGVISGKPEVWKMRLCQDGAGLLRQLSKSRMGIETRQMPWLGVRST